MELEQLLLEHEKDFFRKDFCTQKRNLDARIHNDFVEFGKSGQVHTRQETVDALSCLTADRAISIRDFRIRIRDGRTVVLNYVSVHEDTGVQALRTSVWANSEGEWKICFHQGTEIR